uniref:Putative ovule protein n=1 Tax=Solanum chacoense TaxID=4108 RepID=A0A0V0H6T7_SOLCH
MIKIIIYIYIVYVESSLTFLCVYFFIFWTPLMKILIPSLMTKSNHMIYLFLQLRVSGIISNSPYILMLDCDMHSNDPSSARQAMCFHLDPKISPSLAFVQFPQRFRNISKNDIYDSWRGKSRREVVFSLDVATS